jgi:16S rRNA (cytidine1402-2'-O)-methyltransferase
VTEPAPAPRLKPGLYVVATPIGNLEDLSPRARRVLASVPLIAAEDTRTSGLLVRLANGAGRLVSLTDHNVKERAPVLLEQARTAAVALVSDAGTPAVSDPGTQLVERAHAEGVPVFAVPGPSALTAALSASGFPAAPSCFLGFLPKNRGERLTLLESAATVASTLVVFENPGRVPRLLEELADLFHDPEAAVCRELTKMHEQVARGHCSALARQFSATRGECTVVVHIPQTAPDTSEAELLAYLGEMKRAGARRSAAAAEAAHRFHVTREHAYDSWPTADPIP